MINFIKKIVKNDFIKISSTNGIISISKSFLTIISNKIVAIIIGTSGIAMIGQLQNFIGIITLISSGGFNQGLTKHIAENKEEKRSVLEFIGSAFTVSFILSAVSAFSILIFSKTISCKIFLSSSYISIIIIFALILFLYNLNGLILAIVNGFQQYRQYFKINITTTFVGFLLTILLVIWLKEYGALLAIVLSQSVVCLWALFFIKNDYWIKAFSISYYNKKKLFLLFEYTAITIVAAIIWPIINIILRTYIINNISTQEAGLWQATRNLNDYIVNLAIGSFSVYLLPRLSSVTNKHLLKKELISIYKIIIPVTLLGFILIYVLRNFFILFLYSKEFLGVGNYLLLQMVGSFFWMCRVPLTNYILAKGLTRIFIITELVFALMYIILIILFIPKFQVQGIQLSFAIYNFFYLLAAVCLVKKSLDSKIL